MKNQVEFPARLFERYRVQAGKMPALPAKSFMKYQR